MKTTIILGGGHEQEKIYKIAKENQFKIIGVDKKANFFCKKYCNFVINESIKNPKEIFSKIKEIKKTFNRLKIIGVLSISSDIPYTVAYLSKKFNLPSIKISSAITASNKILMKKKFVLHNIPTANFFVFKDFKSFFTKYKKLKKKYILKPSNSRGSRGIFVIKKNININLLKKNFLIAVNESSEKKVILEEYLDGPQLSAEGIFINKKFFNIGLSDRNYETTKKYLPNIIEDGGTTPSAFTNFFSKEIEDIMSKSGKALGISFGTLKGDIVFHENKIKIIEIAARISGGYFATDTIPLVYNYDLVKNYFLLSIGKKPQNLKKISIKKFVTQRFFFPKPGVIKKIKKKKIKNIHKLKIYLKQGDRQNKISNHTQRAGMVICYGKTYEESIINAENAIKKIKFYY